MATIEAMKSKYKITNKVKKVIGSKMYVPLNSDRRKLKTSILKVCTKNGLRQLLT